MLILGIDPGTGRTGWGVVQIKENNNLIYIGHGCVVTEQEMPMHERLLSVYDSLTTIVQKFKPNCIVVEQIFFGINSRTAITVSQARGVSMLIVAKAKLPFFEYTSMQVKSLVGGSGKIEKNEMKQVVRRLLSKNQRTLSFSAKDKAFDDAADALAIAIHHAWKVSGKDKIVLEQKAKILKLQKEKTRKKKKR